MLEKIISKIFNSRASLIPLNTPFYLSLIMVLTPILNFLSGISVNLYAPSLPSIATQLHTSVTSSQNAITASTLGFACGCALFGPLLDLVGRRSILLIALFLYVISNGLAAYSTNIYQLLSLLFVQGIMTSAVSIGCRAMIVDHFQGNRAVIAILYASLAYGLGVVSGPFVGGYLEYYFRWQANFYALSLCAAFILLIFLIFVKEQYQKNQEITLPKILTYYGTLIKNKRFLSGAIILGLTQLQLMIYPAIGPNFVENQLHYSSISYGKSASIVSCGYLIGTLTSRCILSYFSPAKLIKIGLLLSLLLAIFQFCFSLLSSLNLFALTFPIALMGFASGFIFANLLSQLLTSSTHAATSLSVQLFILMGTSSFGIFFISFFKITSLYHFSTIYSTIIILQWVFYVYYYRMQQLT